MSDSTGGPGPEPGELADPRPSRHEPSEGPWPIPARPSILRLLYNHNPFYLISALLVLFGVKESFPSSESPVYDWAFLGVLVGYVAILAGVAILIVRKGGVWEDARTILLIVVFLLLALSASFDEKVISDPAAGTILLVSGLAFSVLVTAVLLRGMRMRLPPLYLGPFLAMLCGFFLYPPLLRVVLERGARGATDWAVLGFSPFFAALLLTLIPAVRRGSAYIRENGTPWPWPWYPWTLFVFVTVCACGRIFYLTIPFGLGSATRLSSATLDSIFAPYFLVPVALAACALVLEASIVSGSRRARWTALVVPALLLVATMTCPPVSAVQERALGGSLSTQAQREFLDALVAGLASPAFLTLCGLVAFYAWAWARGVRGGEPGWIAATLALSAVGTRTLDFSTLAGPWIAPVLVVGAVEAAAALRRPSSARWFAALQAGLLAATLALRGTWFLAYGGALPIHVSIAIALVLGAAFRDRLAPALRALGSLALAVGCCVGLYAGAAFPGPPWAAIAYAAAVPALQVLYWLLCRDPVVLRVCLVTLGAFLPRVLGEAWRLLHAIVLLILRLRLRLGTWLLLGGLASLAIGVAISLAKAGILPARGRRNAPERPEEADGDAGTRRRRFPWLASVLILIVVVVLAGLVVPMWTDGGGPPLTLRCASNLRQLYSVALAYAEDHGTFPIAPGPSPRAHDSLNVLIRFDPEALEPERFVCYAGDAEPARRGPDGSFLLTEETCSYAWTVVPLPPTGIHAPLACDEHVDGHEGRCGHQDGMNVLYTDGSVRFVRASELDPRTGLPPGLGR